jgi:hypothetical protein
MLAPRRLLRDDADRACRGLLRPRRRERGTSRVLVQVTLPRSLRGRTEADTLRTVDRWLAIALLSVPLCGCGTTRRTDTPRTATEQLLVSGAVDQAIESIQLDALRGVKVYVDEKYAEAMVDLKYVLFRVRERLLQEGALLMPTEESADVIVQVAVGALGTDRYEVLVGMPEVHSLGYINPDFPLPPALPEVPLLKAMNQHGVAKIRIIAFRRNSGQLMAH